MFWLNQAYFRPLMDMVLYVIYVTIARGKTPGKPYITQYNEFHPVCLYTSMLLLYTASWVARNKWVCCMFIPYLKLETRVRMLRGWDWKYVLLTYGEQWISISVHQEMRSKPTYVYIRYYQSNIHYWLEWHIHLHNISVADETSWFTFH